ncbi:SDR family oxidoreductase [Streptomyces flavofungini]|uniref:SDR family oxidoreductase n=1 Tax=Streptomyces flavofungini TaxID=68200 RepID=A0ABS0XIH5_9ACTN|nr:SDR family oxidoreductase [Streptomyces flavofungini]MBJ3812791.1 SDR family oxidoreductase [Streptomyces flavofungini]GHC67133.1 oxidoreductase [Streptomyces flavofungini]
MTLTTAQTTSLARPLTGRVAVVTGASSGIGEATARVLAAQGARVALLARRGERLAGHVARIEEAGGSALALPTDVTDPASLAAAAADVRSRFGRVDLLVNNAGLALPDQLDGSAGNWQRMIDVNVTGAFAVVEAFVPDLLAAAAERGHADLVNISSAAAQSVLPGFAGYAATKAAFSHLSRNLRARLNPADVRVTNIEPGTVDTELRDHIDDPAISAAVQEAVGSIEGIPSGTDVAELIAFAVGRPRHVNLPHLSVLPTREV